MKYAACIRNVRDNSIEIIPVGEDVDDDDPRFPGQDIHIIPCPSDTFNIGIHDTGRDCPCHVKVEPRHGRNLIIHNEKVN